MVRHYINNINKHQGKIIFFVIKLDADKAIQFKSYANQVLSIHNDRFKDTYCWNTN